MKKFLIKTICFIGFGVVAYILSFLFLKSNLKETIYKSDLIILGDSHTQYLNLNKSYNYSINASPYIVHYNFAKNFELELRGKKVFIAYGLHNVSKLYENRFKGTVYSTGWIQMVNNELNALNLIGSSYNYNWRVKDKIINMISKKKLCKMYDMNFNNAIINSNGVSKDTISFNKTLNKHFSPRHTHSDTTQLKYLTMLIELLKKNDCTIFLINTPTTNHYLQRVPRDAKNYYSDVLSKLEVQYFDLNKILNIQIDESWFRDADHVNEKGDKMIEEYLKNI